MQSINRTPKILKKIIQSSPAFLNLSRKLLIILLKLSGIQKFRRKVHNSWKFCRKKYKKCQKVVGLEKLA